jgi:hypothetical protein
MDKTYNNYLDNNKIINLIKKFINKIGKKHPINNNKCRQTTHQIGVSKLKVEMSILSLRYKKNNKKNKNQKKEFITQIGLEHQLSCWLSLSIAS